MAPISSTYVQIVADFSLFRDATRRQAREAGQDAARIFRQNFEGDLNNTTGGNRTIDVQPRLDLSIFLPQWRAFAGTFLNRVWEIHIQPNLDPNTMRWLANQMGQAGAQGGQQFNRGMLQQLATIGNALGPIGYIVGAAIAVSAAPAIAAAISGAVLLAVGGGVLAAGIASAARDPAVRAAFEPLKRTAGVVFVEMGLEFREPLIRALGIFEGALQDMRPLIRETFGEMAGVVEPLARGLADMAKNSMPGIRDAAAAAAPLFEAIAGKLPELGSALSRFFSAISEGGPEATQFFRDLFDFLIMMIPKIGQGLAWLGDAYGFFRNFVLIALAEVQVAWQVFRNSFEAVRLLVVAGLQLLSQRTEEMREVVTVAVTRVREVWNTAWSFVRDNVFRPMVDFIQVTVPHAFRTGVDLIEFWWNRLRDVAATPVRFVVNTVINRGIIGTFNTVAGFLPGLPKIPEISVPGLAHGGEFHGMLPGQPSDVDNMVARGPDGRAIALASGEFVVRARQARKWLPWLKAINGGIEGFEVGGLLGAFMNPVGFVKDRVDGLINRIPGAGFMRDAGVSMSRKFVDALINLVKEKVSSLFSLGGGGSATANGLMSGIASILAALRATFGNVPLISGLRPGDRTLSGNISYHSSGRAIDIAPVRAWAEFIRNGWGPALRELITPWQDLNVHNGRPHIYTGAVWNQHNFAGGNAHIHAALRAGGIVADRGAWLRPGWNPPVYNGTGQIEAAVPNGMQVGITDATLDRLAEKIARALARALTGVSQTSVQYGRSRA